MKKPIIFSLFLLTLISCKKDNQEENAGRVPTTPYPFVVPPGFPPPERDVSKMTNEGVRLGRMLYYDPILSSNGLSCSSCHDQEKAFSGSLHVHPNGEQTSIPGHINEAFKTAFTWPGGYLSTEDVCIGDFEPEFFNTNMDTLVKRLVHHPRYPSLFFQSYGITDISRLTHQEVKQKIINAVSQFIASMVSYNSRYDKYRRGETILTGDESRGLIIFNTEEGDCFHCHGGPLYTDNRWHNNGLDEHPSGQNMGYYNFTYRQSDIAKFMAPTLRNIALTAPYMHDGRFNTLEEVVEFYNSGVHWNSPNIDPIMTKPAKEYGLHLTPYDKYCLVEFLKTFTDSTFITNPEYASPF